MRSYDAHVGPVYSVQWCPFHTDLFLSCSADWTVRLWTTERSLPLLTFQTGCDDVHDARWSPSNSTVFACATAGGCVEVWDLSLSTLKPAARHTEAGVRMTSVAFHGVDSVLAAGDSAGGVTVLSVPDAFRPGEDESEQQSRLANAMEANVMKKGLAAVPNAYAGG